MKLIETLLFIFICCVLVNVNNTARILGLFPLLAKSHFVMFEPLMKALAERGHEVDVLSNFPQKTPFPRYKDIYLGEAAVSFVNNLTIQTVEEWSTPIHFAQFQLSAGLQICEGMFKSDNVQKELINRDTKYDLIISEICNTDCPLIFAHKFQVPTIGVVTGAAWAWSNDRFGNDDNPAFVPHYHSPYTDRMNIFQRFTNTFLVVVCKLLNTYYSYKSNQVLQEVFGPNIPSIFELQNNMSLLLINTHLSSNSARPTPPNVIEVGGLHVKSYDKIPEDLDKIMNSSQGVILFTFGSMIRTESFPVAKQRALIDTFATLPYTVIWKAEKDKFPGPLPDNIHFVKWAPQAAILAHPKTKLFITHGGLMGTQEAIYNAVPMVVMPFFGDQPLDARTYVQKGVAELLQYSDLTKENLLRAINTVLTEPRKNVEKISHIFRDRPIPPLDEAVWWVEYVIRHKGGAHLKPASVDLSWYQLYLYDVALIVVGGLLLILLSFYFVISTILRRICTRTKAAVKQKIN